MPVKCLVVPDMKLGQEVCARRQMSLGGGKREGKVRLSYMTCIAASQRVGNRQQHQQGGLHLICTGFSLVRHEEELVSLPHNASLALAHGNGTHVLVLVNDRHPEGGQGVSRQGVCVVQDLK